MSKSALITGITGQDGSYLAELLLEKDYEVYGLVRRTSSPTDWRIQHLEDEINLIEGDLSDQGSLVRAIKKSEPDEIYNLAAQSFVGTSWNQPVYTGDVTGLGALRMLEAYREYAPDAKFYQASSSEMFGDVEADSRNEETEFKPRSPYASAKVYAHYSTINYRESFDLDCCAGVLFNHESPRRGKEFVTRKITDAVARIHLGQQDELVLGNLKPRRDWGHAKDYVRAMWKMLQQENPEEYVIATGEDHSVEEFVEAAFEVIGIENWENFVRQDEKFMRPADVSHLRGDISKAKKELDWEPRIDFEELVERMVKEDIERVKDESTGNRQ
ncbi:MAG: GDP-mannose 4,6-dehydratase [Candidatus Nanohalobium sp.]